MAIRTGTLGNDELVGTNTGDVILALSGDDVATGGAGADLIEGGSGNDTLYATGTGVWRDGAVDTVLGGLGDDRIFGSVGDILDGGLGFDRLSLDLTGAEEGMTLNFRPMTIGIDIGLGGLTQLELPLGEGRLGGFEAVDRIVGSQFNDLLKLFNADRSGARADLGEGDDRLQIAGSGADVVDGGDGADRLTTRGGADRLDGGLGDDILRAGRGSDTMTGGAGADLFVLGERDSSAGRNNADTITDFSQAQGDRLHLAGIDAIAGGEDDRFTFIGSERFSGTAGELRFVQVAGDTFVQADTDGDSRADLTVRLDGMVDLVASDFRL